MEAFSPNCRFVRFCNGGAGTRALALHRFGCDRLVVHVRDIAHARIDRFEGEHDYYKRNGDLRAEQVLRNARLPLTVLLYLMRECLHPCAMTRTVPCECYRGRYR